MNALRGLGSLRPGKVSASCFASRNAPQYAAACRPGAGSASGLRLLYLVSRCERWHRQKRQYLLSSSRAVVFCLFFCVL